MPLGAARTCRGRLFACLPLALCHGAWLWSSNLNSLALCAGMISTCIIQPVDMVKVRIQLGEKGNPVSGRPRYFLASTLGQVAGSCECNAVAA